MKNMKLVVLILMMMALVVCLCSCGGNNSTTQNDSAKMTIKVGDYVQFGSYVQKNSYNSESEPIKWLVLDVQGDKALIISQYALDSRPYSESSSDSTWETSSIRSWLNSTFYETAFTEDERKAVLMTEVVTTAPEGSAGPSVSNTQDYVFLLSASEAQTYFADINARMVIASEYAKNAGAWTSSKDTIKGWAASPWWLRDHNIVERAFVGGYDHFAYNVDYDGEIMSGTRVSNENIAVRPALWVSLKSDKISLADGSMHYYVQESQTLKIGTYPYYSYTDSPEPIQWTVIAVEEDKALVVSTYIIDNKPYNTSKEKVNWETSSIRAWLNNDFITTAFTQEEQTAILTTKIEVKSIDNAEAYFTEDKLFLLSDSEVGSYLYRTEERVAVPTDYAIRQGAFTSSQSTLNGKPTGAYWLRSPGNDATRAMEIGTSGRYVDNPVDKSDVSVRPAFWIDLNSDYFNK